MPVIQDKKDFTKWLDPKLSTAEDLTPLLKPAPEKLLKAERRHRRMNYQVLESRL